MIGHLPANMSGHDLIALFVGVLVMYGIKLDMAEIILQATYLQLSKNSVTESGETIH